MEIEKLDRSGKTPKPAKTLPGETDRIVRAQRGDTAAYRELVEAHQDRVFGMALAMLRNREQAEDATQEIFVKAYFALPSFKGDSTFFTWLYRIASNACLDFLRKRRLPEVSLDKSFENDEEISPLQTLPAPTSERPEAALENEGEVFRLLNLLTPDHRLVLTLRETQGCAYEEMADILKCTVNTVKSRLNRAREALKKAYAETYGLPGNISTRKNVQNSEDTIP